MCAVPAARMVGYRAVTAPVDPVRASALNEHELWREMVRWSGGRIVEERGVLLLSGQSFLGAYSKDYLIGPLPLGMTVVGVDATLKSVEVGLLIGVKLRRL